MDSEAENEGQLSENYPIKTTLTKETHKDNEPCGGVGTPQVTPMSNRTPLAPQLRLCVH